MSNFWKAKTLWNSAKKIFNAINTVAVSTEQMVLIYVYMGVILLAPVRAVCLSLCVWYQIRVLVKNHIMCRSLVNLMPCSIKHSNYANNLNKNKSIGKYNTNHRQLFQKKIDDRYRCSIWYVNLPNERCYLGWVLY